MKETVYLESTVISYYTSKPSRDIIIYAHQQLTKDWWEASQKEYQFYVSEIVIEEISRGNKEEARKRLEFVSEIPVLDLTDDIERIAGIYAEKLSIPDRAFGDALHLATACVHKIDYLITWNCKHLANAHVIKNLGNVNQELGIHNTIICTPEELMVGEENGH